MRAIASALADGDLDRAITLGLLDAMALADIEAVCADCQSANRVVIAARDARLRALAARERYRLRNARLQRRAEARTAKRTATNAAAPPTPSAGPALPSAAAAALARAKAKAAKLS